MQNLNINKRYIYYIGIFVVVVICSIYSLILYFLGFDRLIEMPFIFSPLLVVLYIFSIYLLDQHISRGLAWMAVILGMIVIFLLVLSLMPFIQEPLFLSLKRFIAYLGFTFLLYSSILLFISSSRAEKIGVSHKLNFFYALTLLVASIIMLAIIFLSAVGHS